MSRTNKSLGLFEEGIQQAKEALGIYEQLDDTPGQARSLQYLASLFYNNNQLAAAEDAASRAIDLSAERDQFLVSECHRVLGYVHRLKGETEKAIDHLKTALGIASSSNWHDSLFWIHCSLAELFFDLGQDDDTHANIERAKSHTVNDPYLLGRAMHLQALFWYRYGRLEEARSEGLSAADLLKSLGLRGT